MTGKILISNNNYWMDDYPKEQFLTKGKSYEVIGSDEDEFIIIDDQNEVHYFDVVDKNKFFGCMVVSMQPAVLQNTLYEGTGRD